MKILRLRLAGFGPYKNEQLVNFERFDDDGIFLISGKTGAGKSSLLDAICFALYNQVPRFDGSELKLRSDHCDVDDPTFVELDFSVNQSRYRLLRTPPYERPKKSGTGVTGAAPTAVLQILDGDSWRGIAAKPVAVGHELDAILPLKVDQFLQVILLAQNRFQRFLLAKTEERRAVLRTLFNTSRFEQLEAALILRRKGLDEQLATSQRDLAQQQAAAVLLLRDEGPLADAAGAAPTAEWFANAEQVLTGQLDVATAEQAHAIVELTAATDRHQLLVQTEQRQTRLSAAVSALAAFEARQDDIGRERAQLHDAARAARVWPQIRERREAAGALDAARAALVTAQSVRERGRAAVPTAVGAVSADVHGVDTAGRGQTDATPPETLEQLQSVIDGLLGRLGALDDALTDELALPALDAEIAELLTQQTERTTDLENARAQAEALPEQIDTIAAEYSEALRAAARHGDTTITLDRAALSLAAAQTIDRLSVTLLSAQQAELVASGDNTDAAAHYESVLARRFSGFAAELATRLVTGDACAVCGSTAHPQPALGHDEPVTTHDIDTARSTVSDRQSQLLLAQNAVQSVDLRLAEARAVTSGRDVTALTAEHDAASEAHRLAGRAATILPELQAELSQLQSSATSAAASVETLRGQRDRASTAHATAVSARQVVFDRVIGQRGQFETVRGQASHLHDELDQARTLASALSLVDEFGMAHDAASARLRTQLAEEDFTDEETALTARLDQAEIERRTSALRVHDDGLATARAVLAHPDLAGLPSAPVDVEPSRADLAAASIARDAALTRHSSLLERSATLSEIAGRVAALLSASGQLQRVQQQVRQLADVVHGDEPNTKRMRLENYVLAAQLEEIVAAANTRLRTMTSGRYTLEHDDSLAFGGARSGLGLAIRDEYTGRARATHSLSGGETFLASLSLALGLAEVVTGQAGGITLDTLFVDEGFGQLDAETLETAMSTLDTLRAGGRTIGLISHVDSMKEQIPAALRIVVTEQGYSRIETGDDAG
ncbi:AAA family ATPase [Cryobacterium sp. Y11]|uniref:AAA family ATPase n=1 Tax=Cryobacterium sp. Y11 TaxID=2045016 RepID=UPI000CE53888|nr:SMC family ATPase [Cryobacterium sp. Y11]